MEVIQWGERRTLNAFPSGTVTCGSFSTLPLTGAPSAKVSCELRENRERRGREAACEDKANIYGME